MSGHQLPTAREFMTTQVTCVSPETPLGEAVSLMVRNKVSNTPVVEETASGERKVVGFLSEGDCLEFLSNEMFFGSPAQPQTAATMMKRHPVCVAPETDVFTLASIFVDHGYRHLPVVEDGRFVGIVSRRDILQALEAAYGESLKEGEERRRIPELRDIINARFQVRRR